MIRADLQPKESLATLPSLHLAPEEDLLRTDQNIAVERTAGAVQLMRMNGPSTSAEAFAALVLGGRTSKAYRVEATRRLQRNFGNRFVGRILRQQEP